MARMVQATIVAAMLGTLVAGCAQSRLRQVADISKVPARASTAEKTFGTGITPKLVKRNESELNAVGPKVRLASSERGQVASTDESVVQNAISDDKEIVSTAHDSLTLADLEAIAMQNNPTLSQASAAVDQERGAYRQSGLYPNPQLGYLNSTANQSAPKQSNGVFLSQEFVTAKKLALAQDSSSQEINRLQWDQEAQRIRVLNDLKIRYYEVLGAQKAVAVSNELEQLAGESLSAAQKLFDAKNVARADVLQAKILLETLRINQAEAAHRYEAAWEQLATMVGTPSMQPVPLAGQLDSDIPQLDLETCRQKLLAESPQLRASEAELDHGWAELRSAQAQAVPNFTIQTVADYDRLSQSTTVSTLVALPVPLFNRNQGNIEKSTADIRADQAEICRVQLVLSDQLAESFRRYKTSRVQVERLGSRILPDAEENLKLSKQSYGAGEVAFREVLIAQQDYAQSRVAYIEALTELRKVITEIEGLQLTGGLNPAAIGSAIQSQPGGSTQRQRALLNEVRDRASKQLLPAAQIGQ